MSNPFIVIEEDGEVKGVILVKKSPNPPYKITLNPQLFKSLSIKVFDADGKQLPIINGEVTLPITWKLAETSLMTQRFKPKKRTTKQRRALASSITLLSTYHEKCGIATYTDFLFHALQELMEYPLHICRYIWDAHPQTIIHCQHEFGIFPKPEMVIPNPNSPQQNCGKVITWHTIFKEPNKVIVGNNQLMDYIETVDREYDAHIVHNPLAKKWLMQVASKPIYIIPHGSVLWEPISKKEARARLNIPQDAQVLFSFGFSADSKGYPDLLQVFSKLKKYYPRLQLIISGAIHGLAKKETKKTLERAKALRTEGVQILGKYLTEEEVNLYATASDILVFNYYGSRNIASASGAIHRILNAQRPIVVSDDPRTLEFQDGIHCLKYPMGDLESLEACIETLLTEPDMAEELGRNARLLAEATSWKRVAQQHIQVYQSITKNLDLFGPDYYDEEYFVGKKGGLAYITPNGKIKRWSYYNPDGEWLGAKPIMEAIKKLLNPKNMLDAGCGRGTFTAYAKDTGIEAVGIDFSHWAVEHPYPRAKGLIQWGDVRDIKFPDNSFDLVFASDIMEHIYEEDLEQVISELQRVSRKWIFYNIGSTMNNDEDYFVLKKGELPPVKWQSTAVAGHVNVRPCSYWKRKLTNKNWILRDDLVEKFRELVPKDILTNWVCIIINEKNLIAG